MKWLCLFVCVALTAADVTQLQIGVKARSHRRRPVPVVLVQYRPKECTIKAAAGDTVSVHYRGSLTDGTEFDSSYDRGTPLDFKLGSNQVIEGWETGVLGACVGEKRKLKIPPHMGYGDAGAPPKIPGHRHRDG